MILVLRSSVVQSPVAPVDSVSPAADSTPDRQPQHHHRPLTLHALDLDRAAVQLDVAARDRQSQAGPRCLGGEVRFEHARQRVGVHAGAGVAHAQRDEVRVGGRVEGEHALTGHRVERVLDDVGEAARDERAIHEDGRQRRGDPVDDLDAAGQPGPVGIDHGRDQLRHVDGRRLARSARTRSWRTPRRSAGAAGPGRGSR